MKSGKIKDKTPGNWDHKANWQRIYYCKDCGSVISAESAEQDFVCGHCASEHGVLAIARQIAPAGWLGCDWSRTWWQLKDPQASKHQV